MKIGVLASYDSILAGRYVSALHNAGVQIDCALLDPKAAEARDLEIHNQRTCGRLPPISWYDIATVRVPLFAVPSHNDPLMHSLVAQRGLNLLINAGTPRILSEASLSCASVGVLNCHPGLLPAFRGASCVEWALFFGEQVGNSMHLMTTGIDEGPVLTSEPVAIVPGSAYSQIRVAVYQAGFALMARTCRDLQQGKTKYGDFRPQGPGRYHKPIDPHSMSVVLARYPEAE